MEEKCQWNIAIYHCYPCFPPINTVQLRRGQYHCQARWVLLIYNITVLLAFWISQLLHVPLLCIIECLVAFLDCDFLLLLVLPQGLKSKISIHIAKCPLRGEGAKSLQFANQQSTGQQSFYNTALLSIKDQGTEQHYLTDSLTVSILIAYKCTVYQFKAKTHTSKY